MTYFALRILSAAAVSKADELKINPDSYNYKALTDARRVGLYLYVVVDTDGCILYTNTLTLDEIHALTNDLDVTVIE